MIDATRLDAVERRLGVRLPEDYRRFLLTFNGGRPVPANFVVSVDAEPRWMRVHFFFGVDDDVDSTDLLWNFDTLSGRLPRHVVPIASDEFGNCFCLDIRRSVNGPVLFWDHEQEGMGHDAALRISVAPSFQEWIGQLTTEV